jgi:hypothetical protein
LLVRRFSVFPPSRMLQQQRQPVSLIERYNRVTQFCLGQKSFLCRAAFFIKRLLCYDADYWDSAKKSWVDPWRRGLPSGIVPASHRGDWCFVWVVRSNPFRLKGGSL